MGEVVLGQGGRAEGPLTVVDACMHELGSMAARIAEGDVSEKRELRSYMTLEAGGGRRLFRYKVGPAESGIMERLLRGEDTTVVGSSGMSGPALREAVEIESWVFEENAEPIARVAREAPFLVDANNEPSALARNAQVSEWYAKMVSSRDVALDVISARLGEALKANREKITQGVEVVGTVELEASRAAVSAAIARQKLSEAKRDTVTDVLALLQMRRRRERAAAVLTVARALKAALQSLEAAKLTMTLGESEKDMQKDTKDNETLYTIPDFGQATAAAMRAKRELCTEPLLRVHALESARNEARLALPSLQFAVDARLWWLLDPLKYIGKEGPRDIHLDAIVAAYAAIEDALEASSTEKQQQQQEVLSLEEESARLEALENRVFTNLHDAPPKGLWRRVPAGLEGLGERVAAMASSRLAKEMGATLHISRIETQTEIIVGQAEVETSRFAAALISACSHAVGALDVVYRVVLWHQANYQTEDHEQSEDDEEEDESDDDNEHEVALAGTMSLPEPKSAEKQHHGASRSLFSPRTHKKGILRRLATRSALARGLREVWCLASKCLLSALELPQEEHRPPRLEDVVAALAGVNLTWCLARHAGAIDKADEREALRILGRDFLRVSRRNALNVLAQMLDCEPWSSISAQIEHIELLDFDNDSETNGQQSECARRLESIVVQELYRISPDRFAELSHLCSGVATRLAPRDDTSHAAVAQLVVDKNDQVGVEQTKEETFETMRTRVGTLLDALPNFNLIDPCALATLRALANMSCSPGPATKRCNDHVATQAAYHGVCKAATRYAQIALLVDGAEDEVVDALVELFELYTKQVALSFIPLAKLRSLSRKMRGEDDTDDPSEVLACDLDALEAFCKFSVRVGLFDEAFSAPSANEQQSQFSFTASSKKQMSVFSPSRKRIVNGDSSPSKKFGNASIDEDENDTFLSDMPSEAEIRAAVVAARSLSFVSRVLRSGVTAALDRATPGRKSAAKRRISELCAAADQLRGLVYRSLAPGLAGAHMIVRAIHEVKPAWAAETIQEECNDYVEVAAKRFDVLWTTLCYLVDNQNHANGKEHSSTTTLHATELRDEDRELLWTEAVQAAFEAVVEGFASVETCSTEGRALMSMDLQVLQFSLDKIHRARPNRGAVYADSYIKAFYFAEDDLLAWIKQNRASFKERHMVSLASTRLGKSSKRKKNIKDYLTRGFHAS